MIEEVDFKFIPWYHKLWLVPAICMIIIAYPFFVDDEQWRINAEMKLDLQRFKVASPISL
jgi:hypothetical protein